MDTDTQPHSVADAQPVACKVCNGPSPLFGVVDFHKSCIEAQGGYLPISGCPVYYRRCELCGFTFSTDFDTWDHASFQKYIYNAEYIVVDPDFVETRPAGNARVVANTFGASRSSLRILDFGGGAGVLAERLRAESFSATTYDPFSSFNEVPQGRFDLITCFEVMEHVPFPKDTVTTMVSLLGEAGAILFSTLVQPASFDSVRLNWWYAGPRNGHVSLYSKASLAHIFKPHGMKVASFSEGLHMAYTTPPAFAAHLNLPH